MIKKIVGRELRYQIIPISDHALYVLPLLKDLNEHPSRGMTVEIETSERLGLISLNV